MTRDEFLTLIKSEPADTLARQFLDADKAHIFNGTALYEAFQNRIRQHFEEAESVAVVGSGNWRFSLNPEKSFREFGKHSDVDVAVVSLVDFNKFWHEMRNGHRRHYYGLPYEQKLRLRRNSENVYAGFISPEWIPNRSAQQTFQYKRILNALSDESVHFLRVKLLFFRNMDEAVDYYARGFRIAIRGFKDEI